MTACVAWESAAIVAEPTWHELDPMDQAWCGVWYVRAFLDIDMPSPECFRRAVRGLAVESPAFGRWTTATPPRWRPVGEHELDAWLDRAVRVSAEPDVDDQRAFAVNADPLVDMPFRFVIGPNWISARVTHAIGDGYTINSLIGHLLRRAAADDPAPWSYLSGGRRDRVIVRDVLAKLGTVPSAFRHRRELAGGTYEPASARAAAMRDLSLGLVSDAGFPALLREIRDELYPDASAAAVAMVGLRAAFATTLPEPRAGFECLFNTRSAKSATAWGNWSVGVYIHPHDDYSPEATSQEMIKVRDAGLPQIASASMRVRARRSSGNNVQVVAPEGVPRLTLSYTQEHATTNMIPGLRTGRSMVATLTTPNGVDTITVQAVELADRLSVSVSFYPEVWPREAVEGAVRLFLAHPRSVLSNRPARAT